MPVCTDANIVTVSSAVSCVYFSVSFTMMHCGQTNDFFRGVFARTVEERNVTQWWLSGGAGGYMYVKGCRSTDSDYEVAYLDKESHRAQIIEMLSQSYGVSDDEFRPRPHNETHRKALDDVFRLSFRWMGATYKNVALQSHGLPSGLLCTAGHMFVLGVEYSAVPGDSYHDKRTHLSELNSEDMHGLVTGSPQHSFAVTLEPGDSVFIPAAMLVCTYAKEASTAISWPLLPKMEDEKASTVMRKILSCLTAVTSSYPAFLHGLQPWLAYVNMHV